MYINQNGCDNMPIATTQSDFRKNIKDYMERVARDEQTVLVTRSNQPTVAVISQDKLNALLDLVNARKGSLDEAVAYDKLVGLHVLPDDPIVEPTKSYWDQFKSNKAEK